MPKPTIKLLQAAYDNAQTNADSYRTRNIQAEKELELAKAKIEELLRDKQWLKQLCQEQSSSIAGIMRSR